MKIYTKTGDQGNTGLFRGQRVSKDDPRIEAIGAVDECNCALGVARAATPPAEIDAVLKRLQHLLFEVGADLATAPSTENNTDKKDLEETDAGVSELERLIDQFEIQTKPLTVFILPSGTPAAAALHNARAVCRRAERRVVALEREAGEKAGGRTVVCLNRLSDLLFVLARAANAHGGFVEEPWEK